MSSLLVRNLDDDLVRSLKDQAALNGRSAEAEHRRILESALRPDTGSAQKTMEKRRVGAIAGMSKGEILAALADLRAQTANRPHTPSEVLMREGRDER